MAFSFSFNGSGAPPEGADDVDDVDDLDDWGTGEDSDSDGGVDGDAAAYSLEKGEEVMRKVNAIVEQRLAEEARWAAEDQRRREEIAREEALREAENEARRDEAKRVRIQEQRALEAKLGAKVAARARDMIRATLVPEVESLPCLPERSAVEVVSFDVGLEGSWAPAQLLGRALSSEEPAEAAPTSVKADTMYRVRYAEGRVDFVPAMRVRPAPPKATAGMAFKKGERVTVKKSGIWHPAVVWSRNDDNGETVVRLDRSWIMERVFDGNADLRYRSEWTGEMKFGRRGAQAWGWTRWPNATKEELLKKKKKKKDNGKQTKASRKRRRETGDNVPGGPARKKGSAAGGKPGLKVVKKKKKKKKNSTNAWKRLNKFRR
eukprot:g1142.t1